MQGEDLMKCLAKILAALFAFCILLLPHTSLFAQEWSAAQKEVWKNVESFWALDAAGDTEEIMSRFHPEYQGWGIANAMPSNKEAAGKFMAHSHKTTKILLYNIQPVAIKIHGNIAFAHYYWNQVVKDAEGKEKQVSGRWTDILMEQGDKWVLIGDHGGPKSQD
jgi:ketosteroid isomerase-like protein